MKRYLILLLALFVLSFTACKKDAVVDDSGAEAVIVEVKAKNTDCTCDPYISQFIWKGQTIYVLAYAGPACSWTPGYFDASGQPITQPPWESNEAFARESKFIRLIWTCR